MYVSDGTAAGFNPSPKRDVDPAKSGLEVDRGRRFTRPKKPDGGVEED